MSVDQPRPTRRMTDMGPRRMDGFARPQRPISAQPEVRPAARAQSPVAPTAITNPPMPVKQSKPVQKQVPEDQKSSKRGGSWKVAMQFVIGLAVIAGVASAIVYLYMKYYSQ